MESREAAQTCQLARGRLTFDAEGQEGGRYHSRIPHVPTESSGLTIGRGYDLKDRSATSVITDMTKAGIDEHVAKAYSQGCGLKGPSARDFIQRNGRNLREITMEQQCRLFNITYQQMEHDVIRITNKPDVIATYGRTNWVQLNSKIKELLVDLRYRGDYTPQSRSFLQKHVANNDLVQFGAEIANVDNWPNVPKDRFQRRKNFLCTS